VTKYLIYDLIAGLALTTIMVSFLPLQTASAICVSHECQLSYVAAASAQASQPSSLTAARPAGAVALPSPTSFEVLISDLPHQTAPADTFIILTIVDHNESGSSAISIAGIGPGLVTVSLFMSPAGAAIYFVDVENVPGQTGHSHEATFTFQDVFSNPNHAKPIEIPGIGVGQVELFPTH
jgi:hypothetical protein